MSRKKLVKLTRHYLAKPTAKLCVAVDPERIVRIVECAGYVTLYYAAKDVIHVAETFNEVLDAINAPRA